MFIFIDFFIINRLKTKVIYFLFCILFIFNHRLKNFQKFYSFFDHNLISFVVVVYLRNLSLYKCVFFLFAEIIFVLNGSISATLVSIFPYFIYLNL